MAEAHRFRVRVRYCETDQMGVAHHAAWVPWLEMARIEWLRAHGHSYAQLEREGLGMPVIDLRLRYRKAARFDEELDLDTIATAAPPSRITFATTIRRGDDLLAEAEVTVAAVSPQGRPMRLPTELLALCAVG